VRLVQRLFVHSNASFSLVRESDALVSAIDVRMSQHELALSSSLKAAYADVYAHGTNVCIRIRLHGTNVCIRIRLHTYTSAWDEHMHTFTSAWDERMHTYTSVSWDERMHTYTSAYVCTRLHTYTSA
jgi:hypothetical protein